MADSDEYLHIFVDFAHTQGVIGDQSVEDVTESSTRQELGISSLAVILLVSNYMKQTGSTGVMFKPEWVARLDRVDGILSVLREVDATSHNVRV